LKKARIHPMNILLAMKTYAAGKGMRSSWPVTQAIVDACEEAFYKAFTYVEPSGKNILIGIDASGSMDSQIQDMPITNREAAAVMAMVVARTEKNHFIYVFTNGGSWGSRDARMTEVSISAKDSLQTVCRKLDRDDWGGTDCSLPMRYAMDKKMDVDAFMVLTDNDTWDGPIQPFEALKKYRAKYNKKAKLIVGAFTSTEFTIADPTDAGMLDISGLDSHVPQLVSEFIKGNF